MLKVRVCCEGREETRDLDGDEIIVGRARDCDLRVREAGVARRHARILRLGGEYRVEDLGARGGVRVGDRAVRSGWFRVGDRLEIGTAVVVREPCPEDAPPMPVAVDSPPAPR